ncbi:hypothetical protein E0J16_00085 [Rhizobium pisi]|uniref:hypothetical protein n=1 Tax=Rhizobium pisi TaxID=574561 RepID=UPI00104082C4|nr:hypothetical protein [Rhizobium pisi]TCA62721.1 hypothetical protein E0J16_00085 [Rhizobium pisi]
MEFWIGAGVLGYLLAGVTRINTDIRGGVLNAPRYVRDGRVDVALAATLAWPLHRGLIGIVLTLVSTVLMTAGLMWIVSFFLGVTWQIGIIAVVYLFLLYSNLAMMRQ